MCKLHIILLHCDVAFCWNKFLFYTLQYVSLKKWGSGSLAAWGSASLAAQDCYTYKFLSYQYASNSRQYDLIYSNIRILSFNGVNKDIIWCQEHKFKENPVLIFCILQPYASHISLAAVTITVLKTAFISLHSLHIAYTSCNRWTYRAYDFLKAAYKRALHDYWQAPNPEIRVTSYDMDELFGRALINSFDHSFARRNVTSGFWRKASFLSTKTSLTICFPISGIIYPRFDTLQTWAMKTTNMFDNLWMMRWWHQNHLIQYRTYARIIKMTERRIFRKKGNSMVLITSSPKN